MESFVTVKADGILAAAVCCQVSAEFLGLILSSFVVIRFLESFKV